MKPLTCGSLALTLVLTLLMTACGGEDGAVDPIPPALATVESAAETGFDAALAANRAQMATAANLASNAWADYSKRAAADGVPTDAIASTTAAIAALATLVTSNAPTLEIARAFNAVSAPMARIYAVYKPPVPENLLDMDYLGRELRLDARAADLQHATTNLDALTNQWTAFRSRVVAAGGTTQALQMDGSLAQARAAIVASDAAALEQAAVAQAEAVDAIEALFASLEAPD
jgi:hypothetical protein